MSLRPSVRPNKAPPFLVSFQSYMHKLLQELLQSSLIRFLTLLGSSDLIFSPKNETIFMSVKR